MIRLFENSMEVKIFKVAAIIIIILELLFFLNLNLFEIEKVRGGSDFRTFYTGAIMIRGGITDKLYDLDTQFEWQKRFTPRLQIRSDLLPFLSTPFVALAFSQLAQFSFQKAFLIWTVINWVMLLYLSLSFARAMGRLGIKQYSSIYVWIIFITAFPPFTVALIGGQVSLLLTLAVWKAIEALEKRDDFQAGVWMGLLAIKPHLLLVPTIMFVWQKNRDAIKGMALVLTILCLLSFLTVGIKGMESYIKLLLTQTGWENPYGVLPQDMPTWLGIIKNVMWKQNYAQTMLLWGLGTTAIIMCLLKILGVRGKVRTAFDLGWALIIFVMLYTSLYTNYHDLLLILISEFLLLRALLGGGIKALGTKGEVILSVMIFVSHFGMLLRVVNPIFITAVLTIWIVLAAYLVYRIPKSPT